MSVRAADTRRQRVQNLSESRLTKRQAKALATVFRWWDAYMDHRTESDCKCLPYDVIREVLGFRDAKALIATGFFKATRWWWKEHLQRGWTLTPLGEDAQQAVKDAPAEPTPTAPTPRGRPRTRAVNRIGKGGNRAPDVAIERTPELNLELAKAAVVVYTEELKELESVTSPTGQKKKRISRLKKTITQLQAAISGELSPNYRQTTTGRVQGQGIHLQNFTAEAIAALFPNCSDLDIENCHIQILRQLANQYGIYDLPTLDDYAGNKKQWRNRLAKHTNAGARFTDDDLADVKSCLLALIYSAMITGSDKTEIVKILGKKAANRFISHPDVIELHAELSYITTVVVDGLRAKANRNGNIYNAAGVKIHKTAKPKEIIAHHAQGIESVLMQSIIRHSNIEKAQVWKHDGAILRGCPTQSELKKICDEVKSETGFSIELEIEKINQGWQEIQGKEYGTVVGAGQGGGGGEPSPSPEERPLTDKLFSNPLIRLAVLPVNFGFFQSTVEAVFQQFEPCFDQSDAEQVRAPP